jgi:hypothetical protein
MPIDSEFSKRSSSNRQAQAYRSGVAKMKKIKPEKTIKTGTEVQTKT